MSGLQMPDLSDLDEEAKVDVCWHWICTTYPEDQIRDAVMQFHDLAWASEDPQAWAVAVKVKTRAIREGKLK